MENKTLTACMRAIDKILGSTMAKGLIGNARTNYINQLGMAHGIEKMSLDEPEMFDELQQYMMDKQSGERGELNVESILRESVGMEIPTPRNINRYDDDIVVSSIKEIIAEEFSNVTIEKILGDEGGAFYTMILSIALEDEINDDLERKRFYISQVMASFKSKFFAAISSVLPVVNVNTSSYEFTKNSSKLKFGLTFVLSHTNDREWVSGIYKGRDKIEEASTSTRSTVKPMPLMTAVTQFKSHDIDMKMLETAIKACGRSELETFVMKFVGVDMPEPTQKLDKDDDDSDDDVPDDLDDLIEG